MNTQIIRFLQQESARLQRDNQALQAQIQTLHRYVEGVAQLHWAGRQMPKEEHPLKLLKQCLYDTMQIVGAQDGSLSCLDRSTGELVFTLVHGMLEKTLVGRRIENDVGVIGWVMENGNPVIVNEPRQDWRFSREIDDEFAFLTRSILCAPVMRGDQPFGVIELINKEPQKFNQDDVTVLTVLCDVASIALDEIESRSQSS